MLNGKNRQPVPGPLCGGYAPLLPVLDDLTDTRLAAEMRAHLAECAWCRAKRATYDRFDAALRQHFAPDVMPALSIHLMEPNMTDIRDPLDAQENLVAIATSDPTQDSDTDDALQITVSPLAIPPRSPQRSWRVATGAAGLAAVLVISLLTGLLFMSHGRPLAPAISKATPTVPTGLQTSLTAISMSSPTEGWAMGFQQAKGAGGSSDDPAYVLHYTNGHWTQVQTGITGQISTIKMLSPTDGWAVGIPGKVYHYDGTSWHGVSLPVSASFNVIAALSPSDIWLAGDGVWTGAPNGSITILHYDGKTWTQQPTPRLQDFFTISSLTMVSPNEGWAVGSATLDGNKGWYPPIGAILHYTNGAWQLAKKLPAINLQTISMGSASDGWAGGNLVTYSKTGPMPEGDSPEETDTPKLWHYTGGQWVEADAPQPIVTHPGLPVEGQIRDITMLSATDGWMLAGLDDGTQSLDLSTTLGPDVLHLEQGHWVHVKAPVIQNRRGAYITQMVVLSPNEFWGAGETIWWDGTAPTVTPLIVHYQNGTWDIVES